MMLLLNILKIIGIVLLCIIGLILLLLLLVLFVPIRYRLKAVRKVDDDAAVRADAKVTWLLHLISASFQYPEAAYVKVRVLGIPVFSTEKKETEINTAEEEKFDSVSGAEAQSVKTDRKENGVQNVNVEKQTQIVHADKEEIKKQEAQDANTDSDDTVHEKENTSDENLEAALEKNLAEDLEEPTILKFFRKLFEKLKNIKYTILQIYDKIKHIVKNIRYYVAVLQSNCFQRAFSLCKTEVFSLLKSIGPRKIKGNLLIGTGDPASTAQVLAIHGMLYPFIGNHINITPDFENTVVEGDFFLKGKITVFKVLKTAIKVYFNRDVRKVLRLLKREAA